MSDKPNYEPTSQLLRALSDQNYADRSTKLIRACEDAWAMLEHPVVGADSIGLVRLAEALIKLLQDPEDLSVASLVIPALRDGADPPNSAFQQRIVNETAAARFAIHSPHKKAQADYDKMQPLYAAEKRRFQESEMFRASLLLCNSGTTTPERTASIKKWIESQPQFFDD